MAKLGSRESDEWHTREALFEKYNRRYGFTLDVAASKDNTKVRGAFITKEMDCLKFSWGNHACWANFPYSKGNLDRMVPHAFRQSLRDALVCMLLPANTDRPWFQGYAWNPPQLMTGPLRHEFFDQEDKMWVRHFDRIRISLEFVEGRQGFDAPGKAKGHGQGFKPSLVVVYEPGRGYHRGRLDRR